MAKVYVSSNDVIRAKEVMNKLAEAGHTITFDWTIGIETESDFDKKYKPLKEREAIKECDFFIYLYEDSQESAKFEAGMAMGLGKKVIVVTDVDSWFFSLPEVVKVSDDDQILLEVSI